MDRLLVTDVDDTLTGDDAAMAELLERIETTDARVGFGIATGRRLDSALKVLRKYHIPLPDVGDTGVDEAAVRNVLLYRSLLESIDEVADARRAAANEFGP